MSAISPEVQFAVNDFVETLNLIRLGEDQPAAHLRHPRMMAETVLLLIAGGDERQLDLGDLAIAPLAQATIELCDKPLDAGRIARYQAARDAYAEVSR